METGDFLETNSVPKQKNAHSFLKKRVCDAAVHALILPVWI